MRWERVWVLGWARFRFRLVGALGGFLENGANGGVDWDREWQKWPVTILVGAYGGYLLGNNLGALLKGKKMPF